MKPSSFEMRPTYIEVDCQKLQHNLDTIQKHLYEKEQRKIPIMAIVKANAYGHGIVETARFLQKQNIDYLGVAFLEEGIELRQSGISLPILVLGGILGEQIPQFIEYDLTLTASSVDKFESIETYCQQNNATARVHLKIDTGMERIGIHYYSVTPLLEKAKQSKYVHTEGIFSHFANADDMDLTHAHIQLEIPKCLNKIQRTRVVLSVCSHGQLWSHFANAGILVFHGTTGNFDVWCVPNPQIPKTLSVQPILSWYTKIVYFKVIQPHHPVSYGSTWQSETQTRLVTLPVGYGDGYHRRMSGQAQVLLGGKRYNVVGVVCMDQMMVNINWDSGYNGDDIVLIGEQGKESITVEDLANWSGTISYEILTSINKRVPRLYINTNEAFV